MLPTYFAQWKTEIKKKKKQLCGLINSPIKSWKIILQCHNALGVCIWQACATPRGKEWHTTQHNPKPSTPLFLSYSTLIVVATLFDLNFVIITQCNLPHEDTQTCTHNSPPIMKAIHQHSSEKKNIPHYNQLPIIITPHQTPN